MCDAINLVSFCLGGDIGPDRLALVYAPRVFADAFAVVRTDETGFAHTEETAYTKRAYIPKEHIYAFRPIDE